MDTTNLGNSGLKVSRLCLGCMTYGEPDRGPHAWTLPEEQSRGFIRQALDLGITFFDTAPAYGNGHSERLIGETFADRRDEVAIATKGGMHRFDEPHDFSTDALRSTLTASLERLNAKGAASCVNS